MTHESHGDSQPAADQRPRLRTRLSAIAANVMSQADVQNKLLDRRQMSIVLNAKLN